MISLLHATFSLRHVVGVMSCCTFALCYISLYTHIHTKLNCNECWLQLTYIHTRKQQIYISCVCTHTHIYIFFASLNIYVYVCMAVKKVKKKKNFTLNLVQLLSICLCGYFFHFCAVDFAVAVYFAWISAFLICGVHLLHFKCNHKSNWIYVNILWLFVQRRYFMYLPMR